MKKLNFAIPFTGFCKLSFLSCFAAVYVYVEEFEEITDYECIADEVGQCNGCGKCHQTFGPMQENCYFTLGTFCGENSTLDSYDEFKGVPFARHEKEEYVDFCMKLVGYSYKKVTDNFKSAVNESIDADKPVIAVLKSMDNGTCRVIIGYDGDEIMVTDPKGSQNPDAVSLTYDEIAYMYIIIDKHKPEYTLIDGLKNVEKSLSYVLDNGVWDDIHGKFKFWDGLKDMPFEETIARFKKVREICWNFDRCHNVSSAFKSKIIQEPITERYGDYILAIDRAYSNSHDVQWGIQALYDSRDWSIRMWESKEAGMCMFAQWAIDRLKKNDEDVLATVREMIRMIESDT